jgi:probable F420-dependent oxidoreductase
MRKRWSLSVPMDGFALPELAEVAREAERLGYTDAWSFEVDGVDGFTPLTVIALATGMRVGTAIANVYTRGPATLASTAAGLADVAPGRFVLGIGAGSQPIVESWNGGRFSKPATRVRETAQLLRAALAGERVVFKGQTVTSDGFRLTKVPARPVPIHIAALREGMLRVAGEVGDGVILNWLSPDDVPRSVAVVREAARRAGRDPEAIEVTARLFVNLDPPGPESEVVVRRHIAGYLNVPVYKAFQQWLGRSEALGPMWAAWEAGDRKGALAAIPTQVMDDLMPRGDFTALKARIQRYLDRGIDTAFLSLMTSETDPRKKRDLMLDALRAMAPRA